MDIEEQFKDKYFSIAFFNYQGLDLVSELTGIEFFLLIYEISIGNHFLFQRSDGKFDFFQEPDDASEEITFTEFTKIFNNQFK
ncbi:hypothetical protein ACTS93_15430 [Empedobacter falsenii]